MSAPGSSDNSELWWKADCVLFHPTLCAAVNVVDTTMAWPYNVS